VFDPVDDELRHHDKYHVRDEHPEVFYNHINHLHCISQSVSEALILAAEIGRAVAVRVSGMKIPWVAWLGLFSLSSVWLLQAC